MFGPVVDKRIIRLVGNDKDPFLPRQIGQFPHHLPRDHGTRRVVWGINDQAPRFLAYPFLDRFKLQDELLGGSAELAELSGGALGMFHQAIFDKNVFYIAYGTAGVAKIDWTDPAAPILVDHIDTAGEATDVEVVNGRAYVADGSGGLVLIK